MLIFPKKDIIPIFLPPICLIDKYNKYGSYHEMNPSLYINPNGHVTILIRCVNYEKTVFSPKYNSIICPSGYISSLYENKSNSIYYILNGTLTENDKLDIEDYDCNLLSVNYNLPTYNTYWTGIEDIRFCDNGKILATVPELNIQGNPSIFSAELSGNLVSNFVNYKPNNMEKNWMPYLDKDGKFKVIYSVSPFIIKSIEEVERAADDDSNLIEINIDEELREKVDGYHGSTNGINGINFIALGEDERLFLIHKGAKTHRWMIFNIQSNCITVSKEFSFFTHTYIEFICSLSHFNGRYFISIGINDKKAFIIEINYDEIINTF
uniref:Uncharacterized protein n=1 Tax=viral metagenome TaxID=1070528 RepID=A0A6C0I0X2_9ZZZZ